MVRCCTGHSPAWMQGVRRMPVVLLVLCGFNGGVPVAAQDMSVPLDIQIQLMVRIFSFDRAMQERMDGGLTVGILYQERYRASASTAADVEDLLTQTEWPANGTATVVRIPWTNRADTERLLRENRVRILYVAPLRSVDVGTIGEMCAGLRIPAFTGVPEYVDAGIPLGVDRRGGKAAILVNLPAARRAGADLSSQLLHIAEVTGE
jgi:hypothetical protein